MKMKDFVNCPQTIALEEFAAEWLGHLTPDDYWEFVTVLTYKLSYVPFPRNEEVLVTDFDSKRQDLFTSNEFFVEALETLEGIRRSDLRKLVLALASYGNASQKH